MFFVYTKPLHSLLFEFSHNANKLTLNVKKSNLILFRNNKKPAENLKIKIKGEQIEEKST